MSIPAKPRIAFLGLGLMGGGMTRRLLGAGFPLTVYNRSRDKAEPLAALGARIAASPRDAANGAQIIMSMVADDAVAQALWLGSDGALAGAAKGTVCLEASTVTVGWVKELAQAAAAHGCEFLDTPVTGSRNHAAAGELNFLVGGTAPTLEKARPALEAMSKTITLFGPVGSGAWVKLINNFLCGVQVASLAEAMAMIERSGLDRAQALAAITGGAPGSPLLKAVSGRMVAPEPTPHFALKLLAKDLAYARQEAAGKSIELATATGALATLQKAIAGGHGDKDISAAAEAFRGS